MSRQCESCGKTLTGEYAETPWDEGWYCYDCWFDDFQFECCRCGHYDHVDRQDEFFVVFEPVAMLCGQNDEASPGIYEVVAFPYYGGPIIGSGYLYGNALRRVRDVDFANCDDYGCGHLCLTCRDALGLVQSDEGKAFHGGRTATTA